MNPLLKHTMTVQQLKRAAAVRAAPARPPIGAPGGIPPQRLAKGVVR